MILEFSNWIFSKNKTVFITVAKKKTLKSKTDQKKQKTNKTPKQTKSKAALRQSQLN